MKRYSIKEFILDLCIGIGFMLTVSPVFLYWLIHGSLDRYLWLIQGPEPFSRLGGGPFQLILYTGSLLLGILISAAAIFLKLTKRSRT